VAEYVVVCDRGLVLPVGDGVGCGPLEAAGLVERLLLLNGGCCCVAAEFDGAGCLCVCVLALYRCWCAGACVCAGNFCKVQAREDTIGTPNGNTKRKTHRNISTLNSYTHTHTCRREEMVT